MEITERHTGPLAILELTGRFEVSAGETEILEFRSAIAELLAEKPSFLALDLSGLASIDARGLGELVFTHNTLRTSGGVLLLLAARGIVRKMLSVTRLDTVLQLCESEVEAIGWVRQPGVSHISHRREPRATAPRPTLAASISVAAVQ